MKKVVRLTSLVVLSLLAAAFVTEKTATAAVVPTPAPNYITWPTATRSPTDSSGNSSGFYLTGLTSLSTCGTNSGLVLFRVKDADKNILSFVLAAYLSGKKISVFVDDTIKEGAYCVVQDVQIQ